MAGSSNGTEFAERECSGGFILTPLMKAAREGNLTYLETALENSCVNIDGIDNLGCTALMIAAAHGHMAIVQALINAGCCLDVVDGQGRNAAQIAQGEQHIECAKVLKDEAASRVAFWRNIVQEAPPAALISDRAREESVMDKKLREAGLSSSTGGKLSSAKESPF